MRYPKQIKSRNKIEALTGIKSSLDKIRSVIAFVYLLYVANGRKSFVKYSVATENKISIEPELLKSIEDLVGHKGLEKIINNNPLITNQYEPLYVGVTLLMKMGYLKMEGKQNTAERTGGVRFPKQLYFANNTLVLDLILKGIQEDVRYSSLYDWLQNKKATSSDFEDRVCMFLSTCTVFTQFKLRDNADNELFFQTDGIYAALMEGKDDVIYNDSHEFVGPTRIYNNVLKEGLEPWIEIKKSVLSFSNKENPDAKSMGAIISTTLDIHNVKNDAIETDDIIEDDDVNNPEEAPLQQIFYGAPGTGKSHRIKKQLKALNVPEKNIFRTTFHPDSDYSTFVGAYKPTMKPVADKYKAVAGKDEEITYSFVPQAFLQSYVAAWSNQDENVFLIIEEINRGNCAQIFGDLFQLLDRDENGVSEYKIKADADIRTYLEDVLGKDADGIKDGELCLPKNLYIWATMNTSDQSLFPIDSAFKRRWDWKYVKIKNEHKDWKVDIDIKTKDSAGNETTAKLDWYEFIDKINEIIASMTSSADKQLGYFFCKPKTKDSKEIDAETFVSKVIFYLWNDVFKDYAFEDASLFQYTIEVNGNKETKDLTFPDFYNDDESINTTCLTDFIEKVLNWKKGNEDKE